MFSELKCKDALVCELDPSSANILREGVDGLEVGGHRVCLPRLATIIVALYVRNLRSHGPAIKLHASTEFFMPTISTGLLRRPRKGLVSAALAKRSGSGEWKAEIGTETPSGWLYSTLDITEISMIYAFTALGLLLVDAISLAHGERPRLAMILKTRLEVGYFLPGLVYVSERRPIPVGFSLMQSMLLARTAWKRSNRSWTLLLSTPACLIRDRFGDPC